MGAFPPAFLHTFITMPCYIIPTYYLAWYIVPRFLLTHQYLRAAIHTIYLVLFTTFGYILTSILVLLMPTPDFFYASGPNPMSVDLYTHLIGIFAVIFFVASLRLFRLRQEVEHERLKAETKLLKAQLHPHFLFNTLNNLYAQTLKKADEAPEMILKLSALLDYTLYQTSQPMVLLEKEISALESYIELEKMRFGNRLNFKFEVEGNVEKKRIAPLLFMPLVENAFKHGVASHDGQGWIKIELRILASGCQFMINNSCVQIVEPVADSAPGIGLQNLKRRLQLLYGDAFELEVEKEFKTFKVALTLKCWEPRNVDTLSTG